MNAKFFSSLTATSLIAMASMAAEPATDTDASKPAVEPYQLKKRSVCNLDANVRPPFWPIGWVHRDGPHQEAPVGPKYALDERNFAITSILMGPPAIAVINGRAYEEGQFLRQPRAAVAGVAAPTSPAVSAANLPRIRVQRITDGQVWLACDSQIIAVPLKRPELNERKGSQELLNDEKDDAVPAPAPAPAPATSPAVSKR